MWDFSECVIVIVIVIVICVSGFLLPSHAGQVAPLFIDDVTKQCVRSCFRHSVGCVRGVLRGVLHLSDEDTRT